jgi:hypothetical protein
MLRLTASKRLVVLAVLAFSLLSTGMVWASCSPSEAAVKSVPVRKSKACRLTARSARSTCHSSAAQGKRKPVLVMGPTQDEEFSAVPFEWTDAALRKLLASQQLMTLARANSTYRSCSLIELHVQLNC